MQPIEFQAPWSRALKFTTSFTVAVLCGIFALGVLLGRQYGLLEQVALVGFPILVILTTLPSAVLSYTLTQDEILIKRVGWVTRLQLSDFNSAFATPQAADWPANVVEGKAELMSKSLRVFGNSGLFAYTGFYWNRELKFYRAFATDPSRGVALRFPKRTIVITPHDPQQFIVRLRTLLKTSAFRV